MFNIRGKRELSTKKWASCVIERHKNSLHQRMLRRKRWLLARIVGRHVHFFYQLESLVFGSFDDIREVPYPPSRISAFQAPVKIPVDISKTGKMHKPNATIKQKWETKRAHKKQLILLLILDELTRSMARRFHLACMVHSSIDIHHRSRLTARAIVLPPLSSIPG